MRHAWTIALLLTLPLAISAEDMTLMNESLSSPPPYDLLRFNETYVRLGDAANRTDAFDAVKHIPLSANNSSLYLTFGGEIRERFESTQDLNFGIGASADSYLLQRLTLVADLRLGERVRVFAE